MKIPNFTTFLTINKINKDIFIMNSGYTSSEISQIMGLEGYKIHFLRNQYQVNQVRKMKEYNDTVVLDMRF